MRFIVFVVKFLLLAAFFIISNQGLALAESENRAQFVDLYTDWIGSVTGEVVSLTGYVVEVEWLPRDSHVIPTETATDEPRYSRVKR